MGSWTVIAALSARGNRDYTLRILPRVNHDQLEAKIGSNAEMASRPSKTGSGSASEASESAGAQWPSPRQQGLDLLDEPSELHRLGVEIVATRRERLVAIVRH